MMGQAEERDITDQPQRARQTRQTEEETMRWRVWERKKKDERKKDFVRHFLTWPMCQ